MNFEGVYESIAFNRGGTFDADGRNLEDCKRYAVAVYPDFSFQIGILTVPIVECAFSRYRATFDEPDNGGLGFWYHPTEQQWYIEAVILCPERRIAEHYAREYHQQAFYHLDLSVPQEERCIYLERGKQ